MPRCLIEDNTVSFHCSYLSAKSRLFTAPSVSSILAVVLLENVRLRDFIRFHVILNWRFPDKVLTYLNRQLEVHIHFASCLLLIVIPVHARIECKVIEKPVNLPLSEILLPYGFYPFIHANGLSGLIYGEYEY